MLTIETQLNDHANVFLRMKPVANLFISKSGHYAIYRFVEILASSLNLRIKTYQCIPYGCMKLPILMVAY